MRLLGLDFGSKTVGVAVSDELGLTATGLEIVRRTSPNKLRKTLARIEKIIEEYNIEKIILGYPVMLDGSEGERVEKTKEFASMLERRTGKEIIFQDERINYCWSIRNNGFNGNQKRREIWLRGYGCRKGHTWGLS